VLCAESVDGIICLRFTIVDPVVRRLIKWVVQVDRSCWRASTKVEVEITAYEGPISMGLGHAGSA